jgi:large subunit ribosomal protein L19e
MKLATQRRLAAAILKVGKYRVWIDPSRLSDIKEAITRADVRDLIKDNVVQKKRKVGQSKSRFRKDLKQKRKGRRKGSGSKKGKRTARLPRKKAWMIQIRSPWDFIKAVRDKIPYY